MHPSRSDELDRFKRQINLTEYAAGQGYTLDRRESSRNSIVMRGPGEDKLVIAINGATGHWIYFSVRDDDDNGTIVDFVRQRQRLNLGEVRKELRPWIGLGSLPPKRPPVTHYAPKVEPSSRDLARVATDYARMKPCPAQQAYLAGERCIPAQVLSDPRFAGKIKTDARGNVVFPHYNASGLCGYELKNRNFTGFAKGGEKGLWASAANSADTTLVIVEAAIDALSYHALRAPRQARYISIGGAMNPEQPALITAAINRLPADACVIIATDNDEGGNKLAEQVKALAAATQRSQTRVKEDRPPNRGQDWNDALKAVSGPQRERAGVRLG